MMEALDWSAVAAFAKQAGAIPAALLVWVILQLRAVRAELRRLPCKTPRPRSLEVVPDDEQRREDQCGR